MPTLCILKAGDTLPSLVGEYGDFEDWFATALGVEAAHLTVCDLQRGDPFPALKDLAGALITGSSAMVTDLEPWSERTAEWLRDLSNHAIPILGVCYGHQLLAYAFGGTVTDHPLGREIGRVEIHLNEAGQRDPLLGLLPAVFHANASHAQTVITLPDSAELLAGNSYEPCHAFRIGKSIYGVQFHPEFNEPVMRGYLLEHRATLREKGIDVASRLAALAPTPEAMALLPHFARICFPQPR